MSMTAVPISTRFVRAPIAARSGNGEASCWAKWWTRKYAPSAPRSSTASASSIDWMSASDPDRTCEYGEADQCPNERKPIFFTPGFYGWRGPCRAISDRAIGQTGAPLQPLVGLLAAPRIAFGSQGMDLLLP